MILLGAVVSAVVVGIVDYRTGRMPNALTLSSLALAFLVRGALQGPSGLSSAFLGTVATATVPALFFLATRGRALGGGDVKALAGLGAWLGAFLGLEVELLSLTLLVVVGLVQQGRKGALPRLLGQTWSVVRRRAPTTDDTWGTPLRFGPCLAAGTLWGCGAAWFSEVELLSLFF